MLSNTFFKGALFFLCFALASFEANALLSFRGPHRLAAGPEFYFMQRNKEGGSKQHGFLFGGRVSYDRIRRSALYWGLDGVYTVGRLYGHNADHRELHSRKRDSSIEGRFGYTLKKNWGCLYWLTPFLGGGYFEGTNRFIYPSPREYLVTNKIPYIALGFLSRVDFWSCFGMGLDFKAKYSVGANSHITQDPDPLVDNARFIIEDKLSYDVELPLYFSWRWWEKKSELRFVPFYQFRHYGAHENYPFDFYDTRFHLYGARIMLSCFF